MANTVHLNGTVRTDKGKGAARKIRAQARIPGVLYGKGQDPVPLDLDAREFLKAVANHSPSNLIIDLAVGGTSGAVKTLIRELQHHPVTGAVTHVDLNQISLTELIEVEVPLELEGVPVGVKMSGGILQHAVRTLSIRCLPQDMPDMIRIDVSKLEIGDSIHASDLTLDKIELVSDHDLSLASVVAPRVEEEVVPAEGAEAAAEPEVVGKKKEGEEEAKEGGDKDKDKKEKK